MTIAPTVVLITLSLGYDSIHLVATNILIKCSGKLSNVRSVLLRDDLVCMTYWYATPELIGMLHLSRRVCHRRVVRDLP